MSDRVELNDELLDDVAGGLFGDMKSVTQSETEAHFAIDNTKKEDRASAKKALKKTIRMVATEYKVKKL